jgi:hypothetical protein
MKKIIFINLAILSFTVLTNTTVSAQGDLAVQNRKPTVTANTEAADIEPGKISTLADRKDVSPKALRNFEKLHKDITDPIWYKVSTGYVVCFKNNGTRTSIFYTKNGQVYCTINYYNEEKLPSGVRHVVKSNFYDFNITFVTEVNKNDVTSYLVRIEDKTNIKTVKVIGGEWEVMEEYVKK